MVETLCTAPFAEMPIRKIDSNIIEDYLMAKRSEITRRGTQRSAGSCNRLRAVLSGIFKYARKRKYYAGDNPVSEIEPYDEKGSRRTRKINAKEEADIMTELNRRDPILRHVAEIALKTGMRRTEICTLRWEWVDFARGKRGYICLPAEVCKNQNGRSVPMLYNVRELLLELRGDEEKTAGAVFGLDPNSTGIRIANACKSIGLEGVGLHVMRHTFATRCLDAGVHPFVVKQWLGHKSLAMTDYYSHVQLDEMENAITKLEARMGENGAKNGQEQAANVPEIQNMAANSAASAV
jgi:integrase